MFALLLVLPSCSQLFWLVCVRGKKLVEEDKIEDAENVDDIDEDGDGHLDLNK